MDARWSESRLASVRAGSRVCAWGSPRRAAWRNRWSIELSGVSSLQALGAGRCRARARPGDPRRDRCAPWRGLRGRLFAGWRLRAWWSRRRAAARARSSCRALCAPRSCTASSSELETGALPPHSDGWRSATAPCAFAPGSGAGRRGGREGVADCTRSIRGDLRARGRARRGRRADADRSRLPAHARRDAGARAPTGARGRRLVSERTSSQLRGSEAAPRW